LRDEALLAAYRRAIWEVRLPHGTVTLTLAERVASAASPEARCPGGASAILPAGIITAYNPRSVLRARDQNRAAHRRLRSTLIESSAVLLPTLARDADSRSRAWDEPGYLVFDASRELLVRIAGEFDQNAIVWIDRSCTPSLVAVRAGFCGAWPGDVLTIP
jgi:hypothetical protein